MKLIILLIKNRYKIWHMSLDDFRNKFAGSVLGVIWAFVQPIVIVSIYWYIFDRGLAQKNSDEMPYILWMIAGMCPWFFFSDGVSSATNSLIDYSYIVKKISFNVDILPVIKIISSLFVHIFFIILVGILYAVYGYAPRISYLQIIYYLFANMVLILAVSYLTSAIAAFFKDMTQIVGIILQYAMWAIPIMLDVNSYTEFVANLFKYNPMYYITEGYRDSFIRQIWFWDKPEATIYFWCFVIILFMIGKSIFDKLKPHFSDVL